VAEPDPDAKIAKLKDGRTHLAYKREQAVDLDSGAVVAAAMHPADQGDTTTMPGTLANAAEHLAAVEVAPTPEDPAALVADKGYHSRAGLKSLEDGPWKSRIAEPRRDEFLRWHGDNAARRAVYNNRARLLSEVARQAFKLRAERVERGFALSLDRGGMHVAARPGEGAEALPDPRRRLQSRPDHAPPDRGRNAAGARSAGLRLGWRHLDAGWRAHRRSPGDGRGSDRCPCRQYPGRPVRLDADFVNGLVNFLFVVCLEVRAVLMNYIYPVAGHMTILT
jgi:hypothetical protein